MSRGKSAIIVGIVPESPFGILKSGVYYLQIVSPTKNCHLICMHPNVSGLLKIERYTRHATHVKLAAFL